MTSGEAPDRVPQEHKASAPRAVGCFVLTISDSKTYIAAGIRGPSFNVRPDIRRKPLSMWTSNGGHSARSVG